MNRNLLNGVLIVAVLGLGTTVYVSQKKSEPSVPLIGLKAEAINAIRIEHPGAPVIALQKKDGQWRLTEPVNADVDPLEVNGILAVASLETQLTLDSKTVNLKELGLEPPSYTVTLNDQKIEIGGEEPLQYRRYVRTPEKIAVIATPPSAGLDADYSDLVTKQILPNGAEIQSIEGPGFALTRSEDVKSWAVPVGQSRVSADARQKLINGWQQARALWNAAMPADAKGDLVTIVTSAGKSEFLITQREPQLILARPDLKVSYTLSGELTKELLQFNEPPLAEAASSPVPDKAP